MLSDSGMARGHHKEEALDEGAQSGRSAVSTWTEKDTECALYKGKAYLMR